MSGFDCQFIKEPAEYLQCYCPICLLILREPYQVTCCGKSFCKDCIQPIQAINQQCPTCNQRRYSSFENKGLQQPLYGFQVFCSNRDEGCSWQGELRQLDQHLNVKPDKKKQLVGCANTKLKCSFCGRLYQRREMECHQTSECLMRHAASREQNYRPMRSRGASSLHHQHQRTQSPTSAPQQATNSQPQQATGGILATVASVASAASSALDLDPLIKTFKSLLPRVSADSDESTSEDSQHLEHQQLGTHNSLIDVNAPINKKAPIIANAPITVNAPLNVKARVEANAPLRVEAPMTIKAQVIVNAEMVVTAPMNIKAPLIVNAPVVVNAPVFVKNRTTINVPVTINKAAFL